MSFELDGLRVCHFGDFGQSSLRDEQAEAIGEVDLLFIPVGGGPTIGAEQARDVVRRLCPRWAVPMRYRTPRIGLLESADALLDGGGDVVRPAGAVFETAELAPAAAPLLVAPRRSLEQGRGGVPPGRAGRYPESVSACSYSPSRNGTRPSTNRFVG